MSEHDTQYKFSFIIPVLNGEKFIGSCIDHILAEMQDGDELIVVDNGSTDGTLDIVGQYDSIKLLQFPGSTIAALRNRGSEAATGDLFAFIDSDCLICPGWRQEVQSVLKDESIDATGSRYDIPEKPHWIEKAWYSKKSRGQRRINYINSGNLVLKRNVFKAVGGFDEVLVTDEDYDLGERLNQKGHVIVEAPQVRAIHLGNPKSLRAFYRKERWHATSSLRALQKGKLDRPTVMAIAFLACALAALVLLATLSWTGSSLILIPALILAVPVVTALYRGFQYQAYSYIPSLATLYFVFYIVRASILIRYLYLKVLGRTLDNQP